ncbi:MAG: nitroreductase family protein [Oligoflexia bacterium]|nr:nitroreductase family protein [Oligoflexia bacterium]
MPIITSRTRENGRVKINYNLCTVCGICSSICSMIVNENGKMVPKPDSFFGCFACGSCAAVCPRGAISIEGRCFSTKDLIDLPREFASYEHMYGLMLKRRSTRNFQDKPVASEIINKIILAAETAPMGIPPSDVKVLILDNKAKVREFAFDYLGAVEKMKWMFGLIKVLGIFMSKEKREAFKCFIIPLFQELLKGKKQGLDYLFYDAPLAMYFYRTPYTEDGDVMIAATYAMLASESLGLGSCMIGSVAPLIQRMPKWFKSKYGIINQDSGGIVVIFGHPKYKFQKAIKRTFAEVRK